MIGKRLGFFVIIVLSIAFLWGAILGFGTSFDCVWPSTDELIANPRLPTPSIASGLDDQATTDLVATVVQAIARRGASGIRFTTERDFIEHALPISPHVWQYRDGELVSVDESVALRAMQKPVDMAAYFAGDYPRLFRFAVMQADATHACVIVEVDEPVGGMNYFAYWHLFRSGFGHGRWWAISEGGVTFGW